MARWQEGKRVINPFALLPLNPLAIQVYQLLVRRFVESVRKSSRMPRGLPFPSVTDAPSERDPETFGLRGKLRQMI